MPEMVVMCATGLVIWVSFRCDQSRNTEVRDINNPTIVVMIAARSWVLPQRKRVAKKLANGRTQKSCSTIYWSMSSRVLSWVSKRVTPPNKKKMSVPIGINTLGKLKARSHLGYWFIGSRRYEIRHQTLDLRLLRVRT